SSKNRNHTAIASRGRAQREANPRSHRPGGRAVNPARMSRFAGDARVRSAATERLRLTIAYDGRKFRGWQSQASKDSVQDHLEHAFHDLCGKRIVVHGAGR